MGKFKNLGKRPNRKDEVHLRSKYIDHSRRFLDWVNNLGFEQTFFGRLANRLDQKFNVRQIAVLFLFSLLLSFLIFYDFDFQYTANEGDIAATDIKSPISFQIVDERATESKRREAEEAVPSIFDYDPDVYEHVFTRIYTSFRSMRKLVRAVDWPENDLRREERIKDFLQYKSQFENELGAKVSDRIFEWLVEKQFSARIENILIRALVKWSTENEYIVDGSADLIAEGTPILVRVVDRGGDPQDEAMVRAEQILELQKRAEFSLAGVRGANELDPRDEQNLRQLARNMLIPNLSYNRQETSDRRAKARESVLPVQISVKKNQTIVSAGSVIQPIHATIMAEIRNLKSDRRTDFIALVSALLFVLLTLVFFSYLRRFTGNRVKVESKDIVVMGIITFGVVAITKLFLFMTDAAFVAKFGSLIPQTVFLYAAPIAAGPMLVGLLITSGEVVWLFTAFLALTLALMVDMNFAFLVVAMIGGIAAARGVYNCKKRNDIYLAGLRTGLINAAVITLILLLQKLGDVDLFEALLWNVPAGFVGGVLSAMVAMTFVPLLESLFNYTTDVKLLELASLNHPLMQEMIVKAPGTYHHSLVVGSMVEAAGSDIGANALLAKVMAYYHDIGKMEHAQYFIENQRQGHNPHDHISPYMSKTILIAHVKDGAEMGLEHKLGKPIIDGILQHHGTTLISFFYNKALEEQDEDIDHVEEDDFRYPGPKPQFREAALVMLADSIEAAARSLDEPTPSRLQNIVKNIIQNKFLDGQLDECNLTLRDLSVIERAFKRVLLGIYHQRIDYPKMSTSNKSGSSNKRASKRSPFTA